MSLFFASLISLINALGVYIIHSPSYSFCDNSSQRGKVSLNVDKEPNIESLYPRHLQINITLIDDNKKEYPCECQILPSKNSISGCLFTPPTNNNNNYTNLYYKKGSLATDITSCNITFKDDFYIIHPNCKFLDYSYNILYRKNTLCDDTKEIVQVNFYFEVKKKNYISVGTVKFNMTLIELNGKEYPTECEINFDFSFCLLTTSIPDYITHLFYKEDSLVITSEGSGNISIEKYFFLEFYGCNSLEKNVTLSFRQIKSYKINGMISFELLTLTTEPIKKGSKIVLFGTVYFNEGRDGHSGAECVCSLYDSVDPKEGISQADFTCISTYDRFDNYKTFFQLDKSKDVGGIPFYAPSSTDPLKTDQSIKGGGYKIDYSKSENKNIIPPIFYSESINETLCQEKGIFVIIGSIKENINKNIEFNLILGDYYQYYLSICKIRKNNNGKGLIICRLKNEILGRYLKAEQQIIKFGEKELFFLERIKTEKLVNCSYAIDTSSFDEEIRIIDESSNNTENTEGSITIDDNSIYMSDELNNETQDIIKAETKLNLNLTFRQFNLFVFNEITHLITFKLFSITSQTMEKGKTIILFIYLIFEDGTVDSTLSKAKCTLDESVNPKDKEVQADFSCNISGLDKSKKYKSFILNYSDDFSGIPKNKTLLDPIKTAEAIEKGYLIDYSDLENKNKFPPLFIPESINGTSCLEEGIFKIFGSFSEIIENTIEFELPLTYPQNYLSKCRVEKTKAKNGEIICKILNQISSQPLMFKDK